MGQYYKPINIETMKWVYSHSYGSGLKLMEHSWVGNEFVGVVMNLLKKNGLWFMKPIVWCGDYFDEAGETPYYSMVKDEDELKGLPSMSKEEQKKCILVNYTQKEYVMYSKLPSNDGWIVNPLPLLTACGNNRGGGDYRDCHSDFDKVGIWAGDRLGIVFDIPYGFWELTPKFYED